MSGNKFAPIALFVYKRPDHTRRALEALGRNPEFLDSELFIFCDGAMSHTDWALVEQTRIAIHDWPHPRKTVIERTSNWGLARSIIQGVTTICKEFGRIIVVEDDLVVSPMFLGYVNAALRYYENDVRVMQVSGHMFSAYLGTEYDAVLLPFTSSWGWGTWSRAWQLFDATMSGYDVLRNDRSMRRRFDLNGTYPYYSMLQRQVMGKVDSWAIRWYLSVFLQDGLVAFPVESLVFHAGNDFTATHAIHNHHSQKQVLGARVLTHFPPVQLDKSIAKRAIAARSRSMTWRGRISNILARFI